MTEVSWPVDLHAHSTFSDGELDPVALVHLAARRGVRVPPAMVKAPRALPRASSSSPVWR